MGGLCLQAGDKELRGPNCQDLRFQFFFVPRDSSTGFDPLIPTSGRLGGQRRGVCGVLDAQNKKAFRTLCVHETHQAGGPLNLPTPHECVCVSSCTILSTTRDSRHCYFYSPVRTGLRTVGYLAPCQALAKPGESGYRSRSPTIRPRVLPIIPLPGRIYAL